MSQRKGQERRTMWWARRALRTGAALLAVTIAVVAGHPVVLGALGAYLVTESPLAPGAAIVVLGGAAPFRALEAAALYRAGWAPVVLLVPGAETARERAFRGAGVDAPPEWALNRDVLVQRGVPPAAIRVAPRGVESTLEELCVAAATLAPISAPVLLVTSPYHTRRVLLTWEYVTGGRVPGIVRAARDEPFDTANWWRGRQGVLRVGREYLGLVNLWAGFPLPERPDDGLAPGRGACHASPSIVASG